MRPFDSQPDPERGQPAALVTRPSVPCVPGVALYGVGRDAMIVQPVPQFPLVQLKAPGPTLIAVNQIPSVGR